MAMLEGDSVFFLPVGQGDHHQAVHVADFGEREVADGIEWVDSRQLRDLGDALAGQLGRRFAVKQNDFIPVVLNQRAQVAAIALQLCAHAAVPQSRRDGRLVPLDRPRRQGGAQVRGPEQAGVHVEADIHPLIPRLFDLLEGMLERLPAVLAQSRHYLDM